MTSEKIMPNSPEAEFALLGMCLTGKAIEVMNLINEEDFYNFKNQELYKLIQLDVKAGLPIETISIREKAKEQSLKDYIFEVTNSAPISSANIESYASILRSKTEARKVIELSRNMEVAAYEGKEDILSELISGVLKLNQTTKDKRIFTAEELSKLFLDELLDRSENEKQKAINFGFIDIDNATGGLKDDNLVLIAGRPSQGKSAFLENIAINILEQKKAVYYVSAESSRKEVMCRIMGRLSGLGYTALDKGISEEGWKRVNPIIEKFPQYKLTFTDDPSATTDKILIEASKLKMQGKLDVILVDYLQFLKDRVKGDFEERRIAQISINLKTIARSLNVPVVSACQLNREVTGRDEKAPRLSDLRYSGQQEQDADLVIGLWRENEISNITNFKILKQRNGTLGIFQLKFEPKLCRFDNLTQAYNHQIEGGNKFNL